MGGGVAGQSGVGGRGGEQKKRGREKGKKKRTATRLAGRWVRRYFAKVLVCEGTYLHTKYLGNQTSTICTLPMPSSRVVDFAQKVPRNRVWSYA